MIRTDTKALLPIARPIGSVTGALPVLIQVPATAIPRGRRHRQTSRVHTEHRVIYLADRRSPAAGPRKRRLKREVRAAARILTLSAALLFMTTFGASSRIPATPLLAMPGPQTIRLQPLTPKVSTPVAPPVVTAPELASSKPEIPDDSSVALLSAEPQLMTPRPDSEVPVILPGYVLPADSYEEPVHEGS